MRIMAFWFWHKVVNPVVIEDKGFAEALISAGDCGGLSDQFKFK